MIECGGNVKRYYGTGRFNLGHFWLLSVEQLKKLPYMYKWEALNEKSYKDKEKTIVRKGFLAFDY